MILAHVTDSGGGGGGGGAGRWMLLVAGLAVLALAARMRSAGRIRLQWLAAALLGVLLVAGGVAWPSAKKDPIYLTVLTPESGSLVAANEPVVLDVNVEGAEVAESENDPGGHLHIFIDDRLEQMPYGLKPTVTLPPGRHRVKVEFSDAKHASYDPPIAVTLELDARLRRQSP